MMNTRYNWPCFVTPRYPSHGRVIQLELTFLETAAILPNVAMIKGDGARQRRPRHEPMSYQPLHPGTRNQLQAAKLLKDSGHEAQASKCLPGNSLHSADRCVGNYALGFPRNGTLSCMFKPNRPKSTQLLRRCFLSTQVTNQCPFGSHYRRRRQPYSAVGCCSF